MLTHRVSWMFERTRDDTRPPRAKYKDFADYDTAAAHKFRLQRQFGSSIVACVTLTPLPKVKAPKPPPPPDSIVDAEPGAKFWVSTYAPARHGRPETEILRHEGFCTRAAAEARKQTLCEQIAKEGRDVALCLIDERPKIRNSPGSSRRRGPRTSPRAQKSTEQQIMAFGMNAPAAADFADIVKYDANAGRMFRVDFNADTREKSAVDITTPPPRFAVDFGSLEVGYGHFSATGPEFHVVPEGQALPPQPLEKDDQGRLKFRPVFRAKLYGKVLGGLREWSSAANCVLETVDDLYSKFRAAPEAQQGKIPIVELAKTLPISMGRGARQRTLYAPCLNIVAWTDRVPAMGERTVPAPRPAAPAAAKMATRNEDIDDEIPF